MEDSEEEDDQIPDWTQEGAFADDPMGEDYMGETEGAAPADDPLDDLGQVLHDAKEDCEKVKESKKFEHVLDDHKKPGGVQARY